MALSAQQKTSIRDALLNIDDPYYHNTFQDAVDEDEWFRLNEGFIQQDLQQYLPVGLSTKDPAVWRVIRAFLKQYPA